MALEVVATTLAFPALAAANPRLPLRFWSREEDGFIGEDSYLGGSRFEIQDVESVDSPNVERMDFTLVVDAPAVRRVIRRMGRTPVEIRRWYQSGEDWLPIPWSFIGEVSAGYIENGVLRCEVEAHPFRRERKVRFWTHDDQQLRHPGDRGFQFVSEWASKNRDEAFPAGQVVRSLTDQRLPTPPTRRNEPPVITRPPDRTVSAGRRLWPIGIVATDPDNDLVTVSVSGLPPGITYDRESREIFGTIPAGTTPAPYLVTISASDGQDQSTETFTITVAATSTRAPIITDPGNFIFTQGETITPIVLDIVDPNDDEFTVTVDGLPDGLSFVPGTSTIRGTVSGTAASGHNVVSIRATDTGGSVAERDFVISVELPNNYPPIIEWGRIEAGAVESAGDAQYYRLLPPGYRDLDTLGVAFTDPHTRERVNQGGHATIIVRNSPPTEAAPTLQVTGLPAGLNYDRILQPVPGVAGAFQSVISGRIDPSVFVSTSSRFKMRITATDSGGNQSVREAPLLTAGFEYSTPRSAYFFRGQPVNLRFVGAAFGDSASAPAVTGLPKGVGSRTLPGNRGVRIFGTVASDAAFGRYLVRVTSSRNSDFFEVSLHVVPQEGGSETTENEPPIIEVPANRSYYPGETIQPFSFATTDADGDSLVVLLNGLPSGLQAVTTGSAGAYTTTISGIVSTRASLQAYSVSVSADDGTQSIVQRFIITVEAPDTPPPAPGTPSPVTPNRPPVTEAVPAKSYAQGETIQPFSFATTDADGDSLVVVVNGLPSGLQAVTTGSAGAYTTTISGTVSSTATVQTYAVVISANDGTATNFQSFNINVGATAPPLPPQPENRAPVIGRATDRIYEQGELITPFYISASDPDGDLLSVSCDGLPPGLTYDLFGGSVEISGRVAFGASVRRYAVRLSASDGSLTARRDFNITINRSTALPEPATRTISLPDVVSPANAAAISPRFLWSQFSPNPVGDGLISPRLLSTGDYLARRGGQAVVFPNTGRRALAFTIGSFDYRGTVVVLDSAGFRGRHRLSAGSTATFSLGQAEDAVLRVIRPPSTGSVTGSVSVVSSITATRIQFGRVRVVAGAGTRGTYVLRSQLALPGGRTETRWWILTVR